MSPRFPFADSEEVSGGCLGAVVDHPAREGIRSSASPQWPLQQPPRRPRPAFLRNKQSGKESIVAATLRRTPVARRNGALAFVSLWRDSQLIRSRRRVPVSTAAPPLAGQPVVHTGSPESGHDGNREIPSVFAVTTRGIAACPPFVAGCIVERAEIGQRVGLGFLGP
jgi:hypothetical protein